MADTIIDGTTFNTDMVMYGKAKPNAAGGKSINLLNKNTKTGLRITTPLMLTWGASEYVNPEGVGNDKFEMSLQFPTDEYSNDDCRAFLANIKALEEKIKKDAFENSSEWFGETHEHPSVINALYTPMLKYPKIKGTSKPDLSKMPTMRLKLPKWDGVYKCEVYDEDGEPLFPSKQNLTASPIEFLRKGAHVACIMQCGGMWFTNGKFTITWKLLQAVVQKPKATIQGTCFIKLKDTDKQRLKDAKEPEETDEMTSGVVVEDSDEEEEEVVEEVKPPTPEPVKSVQEEVAAEIEAKIPEPATKTKKKVTKKKVAPP